MAAWGRPRADVDDLVAKIRAGTHETLCILPMRVFQAPQAASLAAAMEECDTLTELDCGKHDIGEEGMHSLASSLPRLRRLRKLSVGHKPMPIPALRLLVDGLAENRSVQELDLENRGVETEGAGLLAAVVRSHPCLHSLRLGNNRLMLGGVTALAEAMRDRWQTASLPPLCEVDLSRGDLRAEDLIPLARVLQDSGGNGCLRILRLSGNPLGSSGHDQFWKALGSALALEELHVSDCQMSQREIDSMLLSRQGDDGTSGPLWHTLDLSWNPGIGSAGARALATALSQCGVQSPPAGAAWRLAGCALQNEGLEHIVETLEALPRTTWRLWDIGSNGLSSASVAARWVAAGQAVDLRMFDHALPEAGPLCAALSAAGGSPPGLRSLDLGGGRVWGDEETVALVAGMRAAPAASPGATLEVLSLAGCDGVSSLTADAIAEARAGGMTARVVVDAVTTPDKATESPARAASGGGARR